MEKETGFSINPDTGVIQTPKDKEEWPDKQSEKEVSEEKENE